jgi:hypothetical protein
VLQPLSEPKLTGMYKEGNFLEGTGNLFSRSSPSRD